MGFFFGGGGLTRLLAAIHLNSFPRKFQVIVELEGLSLSSRNFETRKNEH
jgi:hypothetical protein